MSSAALDRLLAILLVVQLASGLLTLRSGVPATAPLFWLHGIVGGALLVAAAEKVRRSIGPAVRSRRWRRLALGGAAHAPRRRRAGRWLRLGRRRANPVDRPVDRPHPPRLGRAGRGAGRPAPPPAAQVAPAPPARGWPAHEPPHAAGRGRRRRARSRRLGRGEPAGRSQGGVRRFTGSRWLPEGGIPPPTTFYGEGTPSIDAATWRLARERSRRAPAEPRPRRRWPTSGVTEREAVLDCTSGWAMRTAWRGTPLARRPRRGRRRPDAAPRASPIGHRMEREPRA